MGAAVLAIDKGLSELAALRTEQVPCPGLRPYHSVAMLLQLPASNAAL